MEENKPDMTNIDVFIGDIASKDKHDVFIDGPIKTLKKNVDPYLGDIQETKQEENKIEPSFIDELKTNGAKILGNALNYWDKSKKYIQTESEKALIKQVDTRNEGQNLIQKFQQKMQGIDLVKFLNTPTGIHLANLGMRLPLPSDIVNAVVPEKFMLPENDYAAYSPWVAGFFKSVGAEPNKIAAKLAQSVFIDTLGFNGLTAIQEAIMPATRGMKMTEEVSNAVRSTMNDIHKLSNEGLDIYNRELGAAAKSLKISEVEKSVEAEKILNSKMNYANKENYLEKFEPSNEDLELFKKYVEPTELQKQDELLNLSPTKIQVNGVNYAADETGLTSIKNADYIDEFAELKKSSLLENDPEFLVKKGETLQDLFPKPMKADIDHNAWQAIKGVYSSFRSPYLHFRPAFDVAVDAEAHIDQVHHIADNFIAGFKGAFNQQQTEAIAMIVDHTKGYEDVLKELPTIFGEKQDQAVKCIDAFRQGWKKLADIKGIPEENRLEFYMTHKMLPQVLEYQRAHNMDLSPELKAYAQVYDKYLQERKGVPGFSMDIFSNYKEYTNWVAHSTSYDKYYEPFLKAVNDINKIDQSKGAAALEYMRNFFGIYAKDSVNYKHQMMVANSIGKTMTDALIANNPGTWAVNLTQGPYFGASEIGVYRYSKGIKLATEASIGNSEEAIKWSKRWQESGFSSNPNAEYLTSATSLTDAGLRKLGMTPETIGKIDEFSYGGMQWTEQMNKKPVYMGAFDKAETMLNKVKEDGLGKHKFYEQWLKSNGIDVTKDTEQECRKYARYVTAKTQQSYAASGKMVIQNNPLGAVLLRVANFPIRAGELISENALKSTKYLAQAGFGGENSSFANFVAGNKEEWSSRMFAALMMPELHATFRFGIATASMLGMAKATGTSWKKITGSDNFMIQSLPILSVAQKIGQAYTALEQHDPQAAKKVSQAIMLGVGFKFAAPINKLIKILEVANDNKYNMDSDWQIKWGNPQDPRSKVIGKQNPMSFILSQLSPVTFKDADEYKEYLDKQKESERIIRNYEAQIRIQGKQKNYAEAQKAGYEMGQEKRRMNILKHNYIEEHPEARIR